MWVQQRSKYQGQTSKSKIEEAGDPRNRLPLAQLVLTIRWGQVRARSICPHSNFLQEILHQFRQNCRARYSISFGLVPLTAFGRQNRYNDGVFNSLDGFERAGGLSASERMEIRNAEDQ